MYTYILPVIFFIVFYSWTKTYRLAFNLSRSILFPSMILSNTVLRLVCRKTTSIISGYLPKTKSASANRWKPKNPIPSRNRRVSHRTFSMHRFVLQTNILVCFVFYSFDHLRYVKYAFNTFLSLKIRKKNRPVISFI